MQPERPQVHHARCQEIYKQAYLQRLGEEPTLPPALEKKAVDMMGYEPTRMLQPGRALTGGLLGAAAGAGGSQLAGIEDPYQRALAIGGPALAGALLGGFSQPTTGSLEQDLIRRQAMMEAQSFADQYAAQDSGMEV